MYYEGSLNLTAHVRPYLSDRRASPDSWCQIANLYDSPFVEIKLLTLGGGGRLLAAGLTSSLSYNQVFLPVFEYVCTILVRPGVPKDENIIWFSEWVTMYVWSFGLCSYDKLYQKKTKHGNLPNLVKQARMRRSCSWALRFFKGVASIAITNTAVTILCAQYLK